MSYSNESAKQFRAILADDPSQGPAILKHLQAVQATEGRQLKLPRAVLAYELRYGAAPAGLTIDAIRAAIVAPNTANTKAKLVPAKAAAMTDKPSGRAKAKPAAKPAAKPDYRAQVSEIINTNAQRTIDQIMALDIFA